MAGDVTGAEAALQEAFAFVEQSGERFWLADLHRLDGQIALKRPEPDRARAEACFLQAIEIARSQEARMLELRAATDLARLWRDTGSPQRSPRAAGADPRHDRGRRDHAGCPQRPRAAGRDRVTGGDVPIGRAYLRSPETTTVATRGLTSPRHTSTVPDFGRPGCAKRIVRRWSIMTGARSLEDKKAVTPPEGRGYLGAGTRDDPRAGRW